MNRNASLRRRKLQEEIHDRQDREEHLKHYGVKGMKWGVRRYQPYTKSNKRKGGKGGVFKGIKERRKAKLKEQRKTNPTKGMSRKEKEAFVEKNRAEIEKKWSKKIDDKVADVTKIGKNTDIDDPKDLIKAWEAQAELDDMLADRAQEMLDKVGPKLAKGFSNQIKPLRKRAEEYRKDADDERKKLEKTKSKGPDPVSKIDEKKMNDIYQKHMKDGVVDEEAAIKEYNKYIVDRDKVKQSALIDEMVNDQFLKHGIDLSERYGE